MIYQIIISILVIIIKSAQCHTPVNSSDIIIVGGHADIHDSALFVTTGRSSYMKTKTVPSSDSDDDFMKSEDHDKKETGEDHTEDVIFVPTDKYVFKNDETVHEDTVKMSDVLEQKRIDAYKATEKPPGDILFIQGKNDERQDKPSVAEGKRRNTEDDRGEFKYIDYDEEETTVATTLMPLDCSNLNCDNYIDSICGEKKERSEMKYRLFRNECYFRKVNCGFSNEINRYKQVDQELCKNIATHVTKKPFDYPVYFPMEIRQRSGQEKQKKKELTRRVDGRRAMSMNLYGSYCAHTCPTTCTDDYNPECALSVTGERRVFTNHCQLDQNSCQYHILWRRRPLAECTGGKKADMHQNRAFIDWMQRVGIVDKKGKLVLS